MPERRHFPRTTLEAAGIVACIRINPDIVGIIMNISGAGLGFQCMTPVEQNGTIRFSLMQHDRCMDACGDLVWLDAAQTSGGLRFNTLSSEARDQINDWTGQAVASFQEEDKAPTPAAGAAVVDTPAPAISPGMEEPSNMEGIPKFSPLRAFRLLFRRLWERQAQSDNSSMHEAACSKLTGFSAGFATGLLTAALGVSILLFGYVHRRGVGESLISLGERLVALPGVHGKNVVQERQEGASAAVLPEQQAASREAPKTIGPRIPIEQQERAPVPSGSSVADNVSVEPQTLTRSEVTGRLNIGQPGLTVPVPHGRTFVRHVSPIHVQEMVPAPPPLSLEAPALPLSMLVLDGVPSVALARVDRARGSVATEGSGLQLYFDIGKFRDKTTAQTVSDRLARFGLPTTVLQQSFFWKNSYQVLVGPYRNEEDETRIQSELRSLGYKSRPFSRGSRTFAFNSHLDLNGWRLPFGVFTITWEESYAAEVKVRFVQGSSVIAANGRWMRVPHKYSQDEYVYGTGSKILHEIHFSGLSRALLFGKPARNVLPTLVPPS